MKDHDDTKYELEKLEKVKHFLIKESLITEDDIKLFIHEQQS